MIPTKRSSFFLTLLVTPISSVKWVLLACTCLKAPVALWTNHGLHTSSTAMPMPRRHRPFSCTLASKPIRSLQAFTALLGLWPSQLTPCPLVGPLAKAHCLRPGSWAPALYPALQDLYLCPAPALGALVLLASHRLLTLCPSQTPWPYTLPLSGLSSIMSAFLGQCCGSQASCLYLKPDPGQGSRWSFASPNPTEH